MNAVPQQPQAQAGPEGLTFLPDARVSMPFYYEPQASLGSAAIGANCRFGRGSYINDGIMRENTTVGRYCSIGRRVTIGAPNHPLDFTTSATGLLAECDIRQGVTPEPDKPAETIIGNDVWIAENVIILENLRIGDGAAIGAGAVVTADVPPFAIMVGAPARILRYRFDEEICSQLIDTAWWQCNHDYLTTLPLRDIPETLKRLDADKPAPVPVSYTKIAPPS